MIRTIFLLLLPLFAGSCATSSKALEKGQNKKAIRLAKSDLRKNKNVEDNIAILNVASQNEVDKILALNSKRASSSNVEDWIVVQNNYYDLLENIGEANKLSQGKVSKPYDNLCEYKTDLDHKIANHYYQEGEIHLLDYEKLVQKKLAKKAYYSYLKSKEYGGDKYFTDIHEKLEYCLEKGRVYYIAHGYSPTKKLFFRPLPRDTSLTADCILKSTRSGYTVSEQRAESQKTYSEKVEVGKESFTDTSGVVTYEPIYNDVFAYKNTTKITVTLRTTTWINVKNESGQCHLRSWSFNSKVSDSYEEVRYTGDNRAYPILAKDETGVPMSFMSNLERELNSEVNKEL